MSSNSIEQILNTRFPVVSGTSPIPMSIDGAVLSEVEQARAKGYTDDQIADAIGGLMAGKAALSGNLSAWHALGAEYGPAEISKLFPDQATVPTEPIPAVPDAPNVGIGATRDSTEILMRLNQVPPIRPDGYPFCNAADWENIWKSRVVAKLSAATNPGAYPGVDSGTVRLALTYEAFDFGTSIRGRASNAFSGPFTAAEIQGMTPGQFAEHVEPKGAGPARVV